MHYRVSMHVYHSTRRTHSLLVLLIPLHTCQLTEAHTTVHYTLLGHVHAVTDCHSSNRFKNRCATVVQPLTGFLESTFSYIFGDGNPNADIEQQRLKLLAAVIRSAGGAVTAEQLAPYLDPASLPPGYGPNGQINGQ
jgi:hypothetical protein